MYIIAEEERQNAATLVQQAWSGGYKRASEVFIHGDDMRWNPNDDGINFNP